MENVQPIDPPRGAVVLHRPEIAEVVPVRHVYFVLAAQSRLIKIGRAKDAWARLSSMQVGSPEPLGLIGIIETYLPIELEGDLHAHFAAHRVRGEWFALSEELVDYAAKWGLPPDA